MPRNPNASALDTRRTKTRRGRARIANATFWAVVREPRSFRQVTAARRRRRSARRSGVRQSVARPPAPLPRAPPLLALPPHSRWLVRWLPRSASRPRTWVGRVTRRGRGSHRRRTYRMWRSASPRGGPSRTSSPRPSGRWPCPRPSRRTLTSTIPTASRCVISPYLPASMAFSHLLFT